MVHLLTIQSDIGILRAAAFFGCNRLFHCENPRLARGPLSRPANMDRDLNLNLNPDS